jgi:hypothetical protein
MSISSPQTGGSRRPSTRPAAGAKPGTSSKGAATKSTAKGGGKGGGGRPPVAPVKVSQGRAWGPIALFVVVGLVAAGIIGFGVYQAFKPAYDWKKDANGIQGIVNYTKTEPDYLKAAQHQYGSITYKQSPPVGGPHNPNWQRCQGDVYPDPIANEHAVHAMEHGAVWITYRPDLPKSEVDKLAAKVKGNDYLLMSPYPNLDKPISLQAWGYQLKLDKANDPRVDRFIHALRINNSQEGAGVTCSSGNYVNTTGSTPHDLGKQPSPAPS